MNLRRREFIAALGGAAAVWPLEGRTQRATMPVIGVLSSRSALTDVPLMAVIQRGLGETGFREGQNIVFDYRHVPMANLTDCQHSRPTSCAVRWPS